MIVKEKLFNFGWRDSRDPTVTWNYLGNRVENVEWGYSKANYVPIMLSTDGDASLRRTRIHSHTMPTKLNIYKQLRTIGPSCEPSHLGPRRTLQRCYRGGRARLTTPSLSLLRFHLILMKLPVYSTQSLKSWTPVLRSSKEMRYIPFA